MRGDAVLPAQGAHPGGRPHRVVVRLPVAHDEHLGGVGHQGGQGAGHDPALHLGAFLSLLGPAAVELKGKLVADDRLVASPGQGHVHRQVGEVQQLPEAVPVHPQSDGQGGVHTAGVDHLVDGVQNVKLAVDKFLQMALLKDEQIPLPLVAAQDAPGVGHPALNAAVDLGHDGGAVVFRQVFQQVLVVVQQQHGHHRTAGLKFISGEGQLGDIHPVGGGQKAAPPPVGTHQMSVDQKAPSAVFHLAGALAPALHQPPDIKAGNQRGQLGIVQMLPLAGELEKAVVGPDDVVALWAEEHHGQRGVDHSVLGCGLHIAGVAVQTFVDLPAPAPGRFPAVQAQAGHHRQLYAGQRPGEGRRQQSKDNQAQKVQSEAGLKQLVQLSIQSGRLLLAECS